MPTISKRPEDQEEQLNWRQELARLLKSLCVVVDLAAEKMRKENDRASR